MLTRGTYGVLAMTITIIIAKHYNWYPWETVTERTF